MKNLDIELGQIVPPHVRLECYREALEDIQLPHYQWKVNSLVHNGEYYLCVNLSQLLYGSSLDEIHERLKEYPYVSKVRVMFPELHFYLKRMDFCNIQDNKKRISLLKRWIKKLEKLS